ncbi:MAG: thioesterase [Desulfurococcales archaeon]|nr:thioesterase [Desulfurococcales archaeon]
MPTQRELEAASRLASLAVGGPFCVREFEVDESHAAGHLASRGVKVLSTPCMLLLVERGLRECLDEHLEGLTTVGVRADVRHHRPAPVGSRVRVEGWLLSVRGARLLLYARVLGPRGALVGEVVHERAVVEPERLA